MFRWVGPGKEGGVPTAAHAPLFSPGREGWQLLQWLIFPRALEGQGGRAILSLTAVMHASLQWQTGPAALWHHGAGIPPRSPPGPARTPARMHRERERFIEKHTRLLTTAVMRLHSIQVCLNTFHQSWMFQHPSSPTPVGNLVKGGDLGDRVALIISGRQSIRRPKICEWTTD